MRIAPLSRRELLRRTACGFGLLSLPRLLQGSSPLSPREPHFAPRAKRIIFLFMHGGPSQVDTFDPKPLLQRDHGKPLPFKTPAAFARGRIGGLLKSPWQFKQFGQSGIPVSELFPHLSTCVDQLCIVRSMVGDSVAHGGAIMQLHTGSNVFVRPSMGAWMVYGLGTENQSLPAFITLKPSMGHGGAKNWGTAFLPAVYQGTPIGHGGSNLEELIKAPLENLRNATLTNEQQRYELDFLEKVNRQAAAERQYDSDLDARLRTFELAFRMQTEAPEAFSLAGESTVTQKLYGLDREETREFGWQCLMARRLVERGVRFVQCSHTYRPGNEVGWDAHSDLQKLHTKTAAMVDLPIAGLLKDLRARGLLEDTVVLWGGEFGRTPVTEGANGRDHSPYGYTMWMAGGGVKAGFVFGATDDYGYHAVENRVHLHDLHATLLHLMGFDHERLTYPYGGRNFRLTDVAGRVVREVIA